MTGPELKCKLLWATDVHLDHVRDPNASFAFGESLAEEFPESSGIVLTGDIDDAQGLECSLTEFQAGFDRPVYFILGNHDYYRSSFNKVDASLAAFSERANSLFWLEQAPVALSRGVALVGTGGWYDARLGDARVPLAMRDFVRIEELFAAQDQSYQELLKVCRARADTHAQALRRTLGSLAGATSVIIATHVPPFWEVASQGGQRVNERSAPFYTSKAMGDMLLSFAEAHPDREFSVLCGHTHEQAQFQPLHNLTIYCGPSTYGHPQPSGVIEIEGASCRVSPRPEAG